MENSAIIEALNKWNPWKRSIGSGIRRDITEEITKNLKYDKVITLFGIRGSGKSYILKQLMNGLNVPKEDILTVNFEEPVFEGADLMALMEIYDTYTQIMRPKGKPFLFLDEIQEVPKWEKFVRSLNERKEANIVITGSSAKLMSEEFATLLTGRQLNFMILPLSFKEFLRFKSLEIGGEKDIYLNADLIRRHAGEYIEYGGFPEIAPIDDKDAKSKILLNYYETIINRDIVRRFGVREIEKIRALARYYITNAGSLITYRRISDFLHIPVETVSRFSEHLKTANLIFFIKRFSFSIKEQENSPRKVYCIDTGMINATGFKFSENIGRVMENLVAIELLRRGKEAYYWKDYSAKEVDFVVKERADVKQLIQVCYNVDNHATKERELSAFAKASKELKCTNLLVITEDYEGEEEVKRNKIRFLPLWKWLLGLG